MGSMSRRVQVMSSIELPSRSHSFRRRIIEKYLNDAPPNLPTAE